MPRGRSDFSAYPGRKPSTDDIATARQVIERAGFAVCPQGALELIEKCVDTRQNFDRAQADLRAVGREAGDGAMYDLLCVWRHRHDQLTIRCEAAEDALQARLRGSAATAEVDAWRRTKRSS